jgi:hypothetical protein
MFTVLGFIAGVMLTWPALIVLLVLGVLFEHNDAHGWAVFIALITAVVLFFFFSVPLLTLTIGAVVYVAAGLLWSFWRYKRHVADVIEEYKDAQQHLKTHALEYLSPKAMLSTITSWIIVWPFSIIDSLVFDIIDGIQILVKKVFHGVYNKIYESAISALK